MKYYEVVSNSFCFYLKGKIYPENYKQSEYCNNIGLHAKHCPSDFKEVPAGEYFVQEGIMPEYFAIKKVEDNPLWEKYIDWLSNTYSINLMGCIDEYYGFDNRVSIHAKLKYFKNNPVELTLEQWDKIINKKEEVMDREIIGWKLKEDCKKYEQAALKIINSSRFYDFAEGYNLSINSENESSLKKAGVLELWFKPAYKEKTLQFGGYDVTFEKVNSGVRITCNGETGTLSQIEAIYNVVLKKEKMMFGSQEVKQISYSDDTYWSSESLKAKPASIKIGCTVGTWEEFTDIYEKAKSMLQ